MYRQFHAPSSARRQQGAVLFVSLIFLLVLTLIGVMVARMQTTEERMAQNDANHALAVEAAEAALRYAEMNLAQGNYDAQFAQNANGLYYLDPTVGSKYTPAYDWSDAIAYAGPALASVSLPPKFIVESLPSVAVGGTSVDMSTAGGYGSPTTTVLVTQITAHATGGDDTARATLRSIYERE